jgi:hypothetical protein
MNKCRNLTHIGNYVSIDIKDLLELIQNCDHDTVYYLVDTYSCETDKQLTREGKEYNTKTLKYIYDESLSITNNKMAPYEYYIYFNVFKLVQNGIKYIYISTFYVSVFNYSFEKDRDSCRGSACYKYRNINCHKCHGDRNKSAYFRRQFPNKYCIEWNDVPSDAINCKIELLDKIELSKYNLYNKNNYSDITII